MLRDKLLRLTGLQKLVALKQEFNKLQAEIFGIREELDFFKSSREVPKSWFLEFREWRSNNRVGEQPLVSICVATYNRARLLIERSIPSVLQQTYKNFELIVVGDGCSDETVELISQINDARLTFVNRPERGIYPEDPLRSWMVAGTPAFNHALSMANGDYITHLDDDDEFLPNRLEMLVAFARSNDCDLVWHPFWIEDASGDWRLIDSQAFAKRQITTGSVFYRSWFKRIPWDVDAQMLWEPGDWNRFRKIKYLNSKMMRYPEPLLRHYREHIP